MSKHDIFYGNMEQCIRVKGVIEAARSRKTTDAVMNAYQLLIREGNEYFVLAAEGPALDIHDAHYLACFADGIIEADQTPIDDARIRVVVGPGAAYSGTQPPTKPRVVITLLSEDRFAEIEADREIECIVYRESPDEDQTSHEHQYVEYVVQGDFAGMWDTMHEKADEWENNPKAPHNMDAAAVVDLLIPEGAKVWDRSNSIDLMAAQVMVITRLICFGCKEWVELGAFSLAGTSGSRKFLGEQFDKGWRGVSIENVAQNNERVYCQDCSQQLPNGGKA